MKNYVLKIETSFLVGFNDCDPMKVVWHVNYGNYFERARTVLLDTINYNYTRMEDEGYLFPVVDMKIRYLRSLRYHDTARCVAYLTEYENCLQVFYEIYNGETGELCTKGETTQMCVKMDTMESQMVCPQSFIDAVEKVRGK